MATRAADRVAAPLRGRDAAPEGGRRLPGLRPRRMQLWVGLAIVGTAALLGLLAPLIAPYDPLAQDIYARYEGPSLAHPLGLDDFGRDMLSRLVYGARITLMTGTVAVLLALPVGSVLGAWAGFVSDLVVDLDEGTSVVALCNRDDGDVDRLAEDVLALL